MMMDSMMADADRTGTPMLIELLLQKVVKCGKVRDREGVYVKNVVHKELLLQ